MPRVPVLERRVQAQTGNVPSPATAPLPQAAFGENISEALVRRGAALEGLGTKLAAEANRIQERDNEADALKQLNAAQLEIQNTLMNPETDENGRPKGFLNRQLTQARGATPEFDQAAAQIKQRYMSLPLSAVTRDYMDRQLTAHLTSAREQVVRHEVQQRNDDAKMSLQTNMDQNIAAAGAIADHRDLMPLISSAQEAYATMASRMGVNSDTIEFNKKAYAGLMTKAAVSAYAEKDPMTAKVMLEGMKDGITNYPDLTKMVDGKLLEVKKFAAWNAVQGFRNADGTMDNTKIEKWAMGQKLQADEKMAVFTFLRGMSAVEDSNLKERKDQNEKGFVDELIQAQSQGVPYQDALLLASKRGGSLAEISTRQNTVTQLYTGATSNFDLWINKQPEPTQAAWAYATDTIKGKYGNTTGDVPGYGNQVKLADAAIAELKTEAMGKSPEQIRKLVNDRMKDVVIQPRRFWFDKKGASWQLEAGVQQGKAEALVRLEETYGPESVARARIRLAALKKPVTPVNIKLALDAAAQGGQ